MEKDGMKHFEDKNLAEQTSEVRAAFMMTACDYTMRERSTQFDIWLGQVIEQSHEAEQEPER